MSFINTKKQADHSSDYNKTNNGGLNVHLPRGGTPAQKTGDKVTETPGLEESLGINKPVQESRFS